MSIREIDKSLLDRFLKMHDFTKYTCMQSVAKIYEMTYLTFKTQWLESEKEVDRLSELVVKKNMEIDRLHGQIATLVTLCEGENIEVPRTFKSIREQISAQIKEETR